MSTKGIIFKEISNHLLQKVADLEWVDKNRGQLDDLKNFMFPKPAVFLSFKVGSYETQADGKQLGDAILSVKTAYENYADSHSGSVNQDMALSFFEFDEQVHVALQNLSGTYFRNLVRISDEDDEDHKNIIVTNMEYAFTLIDNSTVHLKGYQKLEVDPKLVIEASLQKKATQNEQPLNVCLPILPSR